MPGPRTHRWWLTSIAALAAIGLRAQPPGDVGPQWKGPGFSRPLPAYTEYSNPVGRLGILSTSGAIETAGHPFFEPPGPNGRA